MKKWSSCSMKKVNPKTTKSMKLKWKYPTKNGMVECCSTSLEEENPKTTQSTKLKQNVPQKNGMVEWSSTSMVEMQNPQATNLVPLLLCLDCNWKRLVPKSTKGRIKCPTQWHGRMEWTTIEQVYIGIFMP